MSYANLASMHRGVAQSLGPRTAIRYKQHGRYRDVTWRDLRRRADRAACGFIALGVQPGDRVAILSENRFEWVLCDLALLSAGCTTVPLHAPLTAAQVEYQLQHGQVRGVVVSNRCQAEKVQQVLGSLSLLEFIVSFDPTDIEFAIRQLLWDGLEHFGVDDSERLLSELRRREAAITRDDLATILYTSGTTGPPKGVMLSHGNLLSNVEGLFLCGDAHREDILLSWLPYSHIYARTVDLYLTAYAGSTLCLAECPDTVTTNLAETQPTWMTAVPRFYEKVWMSVQHLPVAERAIALRRLFGPRLKRLCSGGAPLPLHIAQGFEEAGILLLEGYGLTESSPVISFNRLSSYRLGTVGQCLPDVEVTIADDGEILTRGPHVMQGYWREEDATAKTVVNGWLHTGDIGELDGDGFLSITGRKKDLIVTSSGKNIAPAEIERLLAADPLIDQVVICGDNRPFLTAIVVPDFAALDKVMSQSGWSWNRDNDFLQHEQIEEFYAQRISDALQSVSNHERVQRFLLLSRPFQLAEEEVTATLKVRRRFILNKFAAELDKLYTGERGA